MWVAGKEQIVLRDGRYVTVKPGDPLPEASSWARCWLRCGFVDWVDDEPIAAVPFQAQNEPEVIYRSEAMPSPGDARAFGTRELRKKTKHELVALASHYGIIAARLKRDDIIRRIREARGIVS